jgi:hypothetical protein
MAKVLAFSNHFDEYLNFVANHTSIPVKLREALRLKFLTCISDAFERGKAFERSRSAKECGPY